MCEHTNIIGLKALKFNIMLFSLFRIMAIIMAKFRRSEDAYCKASSLIRTGLEAIAIHFARAFGPANPDRRVRSWMICVKVRVLKFYRNSLLQKLQWTMLLSVHFLNKSVPFSVPSNVFPPAPFISRRQCVCCSFNIYVKVVLSIYITFIGPNFPLLCQGRKWTVPSQEHKQNNIIKILYFYT